MAVPTGLQGQAAEATPPPAELLKGRSGRFKQNFPRILSVVTLILAWFLASVVLPPTVVPGPVDVVSAFWGNMQDSETYMHIWKTVYRVIVGMSIAVTIGVILGIIMGLSAFGERFLDLWVLVAFAIPSLVYALVAIMWFGLNETAAFFAVGISGFQVVAINMWQGVKAIDMSLINMGKAFGMRRSEWIRKIVVPQTIPFLLAAFRYALAISWKIVTIVELVGMSSGVGYMLNYWFQFFRMSQVMAWTLTFTLILLLVEFLVFKPLDRRVTSWRPSTHGS